MPLILAIEPDRRQAAQLTSMVKGRLHADLVLAESAERALDALGDRVPDLILTSALLSPRDEAALGERLRALDGAAGHVQTLTIPMLETPKPLAQTTRSVLSALRRGKTRSGVPDGCDPAVFAEQCGAYLERAAAELAAARADDAVVDARNALEGLRTNLQPDANAVAAFELDLLSPEHVPTAAVEAYDIAPTAPEEVTFETPALTRDPEAEPAPALAPEPEPEENTRVEQRELRLQATEHHEPSPPIPDVEDDRAIAAIAPLAAIRIPPPVATIHLWPALEGMLGTIEGIVEVVSSAEADYAAELTARIEQSSAEALDELTVCLEDSPLEAEHARGDWLDVLEVLRRDVEQLRPDRVPAVHIASEHADLRRPGANGSLPADSTHVAPSTANSPPRRHRRRSKDAPIQDEWGFFDPDRCGFAALLAKLEEITEKSDDSPSEPGHSASSARPHQR